MYTNEHRWLSLPFTTYTCINYVRMHACIHICMCVCILTCMYARIHVCFYACMYACMYICMHVCMHACMRVCMHECVYTYPAASCSLNSCKSWLATRRREGDSPSMLLMRDARMAASGTAPCSGIADKNSQK